MLVAGVLVMLGLVTPTHAQESQSSEPAKTQDAKKANADAKTTEKAGATSEQIEKLIRDLGSQRYVTREKAKFQLLKIGTAALASLKEATKSEDMQTRQTAAQLIEKIERTAAADKLLRPTMVHIVCKDTPVTEAVTRLAKASGYRIEIQGNEAELAKRKITLDTGKTTFWKAFDQVCQAGGLVEANPSRGYSSAVTPGVPAVDLPLPGPPGIVPVPMPGPGGVIQPRIIVGGAGPNPAQMKQIQMKLRELVKKRIQAMQQLPANPGNAAELRKLIEKMQAEQQKQIQEMRKMMDEARKKAAKQREAAEQQRRKALQRQQQQPQNQPRSQPGTQPNAQPGAGLLAVPVQQKAQDGGRARINRVQRVRQAQAGQAAPDFVGPDGQVRKGNVVGAPIRLKAGKAPKYPTCYVGAVRIQAIPTKGGKGEYVVSLRFTAEPRLGDLDVLPIPVIDKAIDDLGQQLRLAKVKEPEPQVDPAVGPGGVPGLPGRFPRPIRRPAVPQQARTMNNDLVVKFAKGEKASKSLAKLTGKIKVKVWRPAKPLVVVKNLMNSSGKTFKTKDGRELRVSYVRKYTNGRVRIQLELPSGPGANMGNGIVFGGGGRVVIRGGGNVIINGRRINAGGGPNGSVDLYDEKGNKLQIAGRGTYTTIRNNQISRGLSLTVYARNGQGLPTRLVWSARSQDDVQIPFELKNIPLD